jgi:hypothetical protein
METQLSLDGIAELLRDMRDELSILANKVRIQDSYVDGQLSEFSRRLEQVEKSRPSEVASICDDAVVSEKVDGKEESDDPLGQLLTAKLADISETDLNVKHLEDKLAASKDLVDFDRVVRNARGQGVPCKRHDLVYQRAWVIVLDFQKRYNLDVALGKQVSTMVFDTPRPPDPTLFESDEAWLTSLQPQVMSTLKQVRFGDTDIMPTLSLREGDAFEPAVLPWRVKVKAHDMVIKFTLPCGRMPWGIVSKVEINGDMLCKIVVRSENQQWDKICLDAYILAADVAKLRPKQTPPLYQILATRRFEDLLQEFPGLVTFLKSKNADLPKCSRVWKEGNENVRDLISQAHEANAFKTTSCTGFPLALLLSKKLHQAQPAVKRTITTYSHKPLPLR